MARAQTKLQAGAAQVLVDVAVLQTQMDTVQADVGEIKEGIAALAKRFDEVSDSMTRYKGMAGGLMLGLSAIATMLTLAREAIVHWFSSSPKV